MSRRVWHRRNTLAATYAISVLACLGCVNLDKPTTSTKMDMVKAPEAMLKATKAGGNSFVKQMKRVLPKRKTRVMIADAPISDGDPTRLDTQHKNIGPELYLAAARMSEQKGRPDLAIEQYNMALKKDGNNRNALIGMARMQHRNGNSDAAIRIYRDALNIYRTDAVIMNDLGLCYAQNGQLNESISMLQAATQAAPDRNMYVHNLAAALVEAGRSGEAVAHLSRIQSADQANCQVGYLLDRAGKKNESMAYLNRALVINPDLQQARALLEQPSPQMTSAPPRTFEPASIAMRSVPSQSEVARPNNLSPVAAPRLEVPPVSQRIEPSRSIQALPSKSYRTEGGLTPSAPDDTPAHLKNRAHRFGPFGYVHPRNVNQVQVVSYVEDTDAE